MRTEARQILDQYRLERILHSTVWTTVLRALEPRSDRPVIIKLVHPAGPVAEEANRARFSHVMRAARRGALQGMPRVLDSGFTPDHHAFLITEPLSDGVPLGALRSAPRSLVVTALTRALDTVDELAMAGAAHLNLSLDNLLVIDHSVFVLGNGTGAYLAGAPSRLWPPEGARCAAPELYGRGVLRRDDLWLADLYAVAMMACDALGAHVEGAATPHPVVRLESRGVDAADDLERALAVALRRDPAARTVSLSELRRALVKVVPGDAVEEEGAQAGQGPSAPPPAEGGPGAGPGAVPVLGTAPVTGELPTPATSTRLRPERWTAPRGLIATAVTAAAVGGLATVGLVTRVPGPAHATVQPQTPAVTPTMVVPAAVPTAAPPTPAAAADPRLDQAAQLLSAGDREAARALLDSIPEEELRVLPAADLSRFEELGAALASGDRDAAVRDLRGGLEVGSIAMLRRAVAALGGLDDDELGTEPDLRRDLERARTALQQHRDLWEAERAGERLQVVDRARRMIALLPDYSGAYRMREEAAAELEREAGAAAVRRDFAGALAVLRGLRAAWPERAGLDERIASWEQQQRRDGELEQVLERALGAGRGGRPDAGLEVLAAVTPDDPHRERFEGARAQLAAELARLDAEPPTLSIPSDLGLRYRKNATITVPVTVTDDFRVQHVVAHLKTEREPAYSEVPLDRTGDGLYELHIPPELHGNGRVLLWVEATDVSSHRGTLGDVDDPLVLERKRWYQK